MDFLSLVAAAAPVVALAAVLAEIVAKRPSALAELLTDSETFARSPLVTESVAGREMIPANDRMKLAA